MAFLLFSLPHSLSVISAWLDTEVTRLRRECPQETCGSGAGKPRLGSIFPRKIKRTKDNLPFRGSLKKNQNIHPQLNQRVLNEHIYPISPIGPEWLPVYLLWGPLPAITGSRDFSKGVFNHRLACQVCESFHHVTPVTGLQVLVCFFSEFRWPAAHFAPF